MVAKLENGHRQSISLDEWLALAYVLNVAPVHLLVPLEDDVPCRISPEITAASQRVRAWVAGNSPFLYAPDPVRDPGQSRSWLEWLEEKTPENDMERPLTQKKLDERAAELEEQFARRLEERIAQVISDLGLDSQQSES